MDTKNLGNRTAEMWEFEEWELKNSTWSGNPFDLDATVTFKHEGSNASHTTGMFYDNNDTWSFRFTGDQIGKWTYTTSSSDPDLNGISGAVQVKANPDSDAYGFITQSAADPSKWARHQGNDGEIKAFVPQLLMAGDISHHTQQLAAD